MFGPAFEGGVDEIGDDEVEGGSVEWIQSVVQGVVHSINKYSCVVSRSTDHAGAMTLVVYLGSLLLRRAA